MHWLVTWTTYGSWLPGDPRGFRTFRAREYVAPPKRYAEDERVYDPKMYADRYAHAKSFVPDAVKLNAEEQRIALDAIVGEIGVIELDATILAVGDWHVHLVATFGSLRIRPTVGRLKSAATRNIPNPGDRKRIWSKECHMESLPDDVALLQGIDYVRKHESEGALIHEW